MEMWWWILAIREGKRYIVGPFDDDVEARERAERLKCPFSLHELPTKDENRATRMLKAKFMKTEAMGHGIC